MNGYIAPKSFIVEIQTKDIKKGSYRVPFPKGWFITGLQFAKSNPNIKYSIEWVTPQFGSRSIGPLNTEDIDYLRLQEDLMNVNSLNLPFDLVIHEVDVKSGVDSVLIKYYVYQFITK